MDTPSKIPAVNESAPRRTLLIVDDEEGPRNSVRAVFKSEYNVLMADCGVQAIELARKNPIDAAILDIRMSDMSGIEVLERLKENDPTIEVIMLTAYETSETARQALRLGAIDYLDKPFDVATIRAAVSNAIARRSLSDEIRVNNQRLRDLQDEIQNQHLREKIALAKGEILASVIHDLNGPLTVICGFVDMINRTIPTLDKQDDKSMVKIRGHLAHITRQIDKSIDISRRYLSMIRQRAAESSRISVNEVLNEIGELLKDHPDTKNNEVVIFSLPEDIQVAINGIDLIQILLNLSSNALQCSDVPHKVELRSEKVSKDFNFAAIVDDSENLFIHREGLDTSLPMISIKVSDNGPGIPLEIVPKIFATYFTTKTAGKGTGLGLSIVLRFIKEAGGALHLHTRVGHGTSFTVYLPIR